MGRKAKAAVPPGPVALTVPIVGRGVPKKIGNRCVQVAAVENDEHVVDEVVHIEQVLVSGIGRSIGVTAFQFEIGRIVRDARLGGIVKPGPGRHVAIRGVDGVRPSLHLDDVIVFLVAAIVGGRVGRLGSLTTVEEAPVLAVNIEVVVVATLPLPPHVELSVPTELVTDEDPLGVALETPRVVLKSAQIEGIELIGPAIAKERELQFRGAVRFPEKETQRMFGVSRAPRKPAADSNPRVDLESFGAVRKDQFQRTRSLPGPAVLPRIGVDARGRIEEVFQIRHHRERRQRLQGRDELIAVGG